MPNSPALLMAVCVGCLPPSQPSPSVCSATLRSPYLNHPDLTALDRAAAISSITSDCMAQPIAPDRLTTLDWSPVVPSTSFMAAKPVLFMGSQGKTVVHLQTRLQQLGYKVGAIDGVYGIQTRSAVRQFQQSQHLKPDGVVGQQTWIALQQPIAPKPIAPKPETRPEPLSEALPESSAAGFRENVPVSSLPSHIKPGVPSRTIRIDGSVLWSEGYGWFVVWAGVQGVGWLIILRDARRQGRSIGLKAAPKSARRKWVNVEPIVLRFSDEGDAAKPPSTVKPASMKSDPVVEQAIEPVVEQLLAVKDAAEMVMTFALEEQGECYTYTLVEDGEGLFVLWKDELRVQMQRLTGQEAIEKTVILRRTDQEGRSSERSLSLQAQRMQPACAS